MHDYLHRLQHFAVKAPKNKRFPPTMIGKKSGQLEHQMAFVFDYQLLAQLLSYPIWFDYNLTKCSCKNTRAKLHKLISFVCGTSMLLVFVSLGSYSVRRSMNSFSNLWTFRFDAMDGRISSLRSLCFLIPCNSIPSKQWSILKINR